MKSDKIFTKEHLGEPNLIKATKAIETKQNKKVPF